jgi:hypothetical protein
VKKILPMLKMLLFVFQYVQPEFRDDVGKYMYAPNRGLLVDERGRVTGSMKGFSCHICGRVLSSMANLQVHLRVHTKNVHFTCCFCGVKFNHSNSLNRHVRKKHHVVMKRGSIQK